MQAARGASLNPGEPGPDTSTSRRRLVLFVVLGSLVLAVDQLTKIWAVARLDGRESIEIIPGWLSFTFLRNPGAAFGLGAGATVVLSLVALVVVVVVARMARNLRDLPWTIALSLLLAGALGNLIDRLVRSPGPLRGHVVDFIDYHGLFVGNVADIALTVAAILVLVRSWQGVGLDGRREPSHRKRDDREQAGREPDAA